MSPELRRHLEREIGLDLMRIAREMTAMGLEGCDPEDERVIHLIKAADLHGLTGDERRAWLRARRPI